MFGNMIFQQLRPLRHMRVHLKMKKNKTPKTASNTKKGAKTSEPSMEEDLLHLHINSDLNQKAGDRSTTSEQNEVDKI